MYLIIAFPMAMSGLTFLTLAKDKKNKGYRVAEIMMLMASFISFLTYFFYK
ncbi:MAG: hypothetical protein SOI57_06615 [Leuconostoc gelidum]|jgi:hypothetical protein|uniref:hypothetical protein n=1 Tax=Leuconostoc gelidum TaxID=1244 RepID=UPI00157515C6|nr:hypothetical protein [Leuconostoc gelidum]MBZ5978998.1 hypothetical protein [Leuconostoc gelidum subsp. gelidum]MBZ6000720.1 hypothetical protein [Leuconostoc gelidum subsp. gelidum]